LSRTELNYERDEVNRMLNKRNLFGIICLIVSLSIFSGCGNSEKKTDDKDVLSKKPESSVSEIQKFAVKTAETTAPKDTETPPEQGGYGFEDMADKMGYVTRTFSEEEMSMFGDPGATKGGILTTITSRYPATLRTEGQNSNYVENSTFGGFLYEGLLQLDPIKYDFMPGIATHWKVSDDKMQFWFRINPNARWSDGKPVISDDVVATWNLHMDETILSPSDQLTYGKFEQPVVESKYIVSVKCKELNWRNFLYFGASMPIYPNHIIGDLTGTDYLEEFQNTTMPGTGPYILLDKDVKNQISYAVTRRLDYWDADNPLQKYQYNFDKIKFVVVKDNASLEFEKFKAGEQDFYTVSQARRWVEDTDFEKVQKGWIQKRRIFSQKPSGTGGYAFNMREWPFDDKRVRYAMSYLFNREQLIEELFYDQYIVQNSLYAGSVYENPDNEKIQYNPEKAMELLEEAGWTERNEEGWLVNQEGKVFRFNIGVVKAVDYVVTPLQQMLRDNGIDMQIKFVDGNTLWKQLMDRSFVMYMQSWGGLVFPNPETSLKSSLADQSDNNNISGFKSERVDELCAMYDVEFDQQKRIDIIREIDGIVMEERPAMLSHYAPYTRILFWNKFGYPEFMVHRFVGDYRSIFQYWWFDQEKVAQLDQAMENNTALESGEVEVNFWTKFAEKEKMSQATQSESDGQ